MADTDLPQNWEGASRWFLGGTIVFASGFEAVVLFWEGKFGPAGGSFTVAVVLIAILIYWDRLKSKMPRVMNALAIAVADARLWAIVLLALAAFAGGPNLQREWSDWIYTLPFFIGLTFFFAAWRHLRPSKQETAVQDQSYPVTSQTLDGQTRLDLIHMLDFCLMQSTLVSFDGLIELSTQSEVTDQFREGEHTLEAQQARQWYIGFVGQEIAGNFNRRQDFLGIVASAEAEIDRDLERLADQALAGETLVALRRRLIIELQFQRAVQFLRAQRRELADGIGSRRRDLAERLNLRQQGTIGR